MKLPHFFHSFSYYDLHVELTSSFDQNTKKFECNLRLTMISHLD